MDGTSARLRERNPNSPVIGQAWLKTGSLRDVASVAGYVQGQSGQRYTLVAVLHHPNAQQARAALAPEAVADACGDRHPAPHEANLFDMNAKYADVVSEREVMDYLADLKRQRAAAP